MKRIRILDIWFLRGFFYFYVGFITIENDQSLTQPQVMKTTWYVYVCIHICMRTYIYVCMFI
jgi:hypothetical protein